MLPGFRECFYGEPLLGQKAPYLPFIYGQPFGKDLFDKRGQKSIMFIVENKRLDKLRP
jgi:hypothetical protein